MRLVPTLLLLSSVALNAAEQPAPGTVSADDLAELEALRVKVRKENVGPVAPVKAGEVPAKGAMSPEDQAELDALKSTVKKRTDVEEAPEKVILVQLLRPEVDGLELVLVLDSPIPTPVVIKGSAHTTGQKFSVTGNYAGAAKFEGAYYPLLQTKVPVVNELASVESTVPTPAATTNVLGAEPTEDGSWGGFQLSNILFAGFAAISLAIVALKIKAKVDALKGKKTRRR